MFKRVGLWRRVKAFCAIPLSLAGSFFNNSFHVLLANPGRCAGRVRRQLHPALSTVYRESPSWVTEKPQYNETGESGRGWTASAEKDRWTIPPPPPTVTKIYIQSIFADQLPLANK